MLKARIILVTLVLTLAGNSFAQTRVFSEAKGSGPGQAYYEFEQWDFSLDRDQYQIRKNGKGKRINEQGRVSNFRLFLEGTEIIERVIYFAVHRDNLLVSYETNDGGYGIGYIMCFYGKTLKPKWRAVIGGFNIAQGLIEGNSAYLGAIGFAAKINLETGKYIWKHENFYRKYNKDGAFNIFETPQINGNEIIFTENQDTRPPNVIKFNKISGKVIEVKVN